jgi:hypothetical protein
MMQGGMEVETSEEGERDGSQSPLKNKQKKAYVETTATAPPAAKLKTFPQVLTVTFINISV